ncbi:MAG: magnesium transporter [Gammaproteobacteria bacterium]|jgi:magnesium transporter|nr:magnesium transporter [Gammaproteobacteria bacterium]
MRFQEQLSEVIRSYGSGSLDETRVLLESLRPPEIANLLESTPPKVRQVIWRLLDEEEENKILQHLHEDVLNEFVESMKTEQLAAAADDLDTDDFADILQQLPRTISDEVLAMLDASDRARLEAVLSYPEDTAGGLMNTDTITVRPRHAIEIVLRYLRLRKELPRTTDALIVVNSREEYVGLLPVAKLLTADPSVTVREVMDSEAEVIAVDLPDTDVARIFSEHDLISAPVVDAAGKLLGRITIDDVVDVIIEDADEAVLARAGLDLEEDTFAPILKSARRRAVWLSINLATAFLAAAVINIFEETIAKVVALAVLMPIVASMGGIAGTQTLTLVIRGIAVGQIGRANLPYLVNREFVVAILNGLLLASLVAVVAAIAFDDVILGGVIALAMIINLMVAAISGSLLPSILVAMRIDPAIAGGVVLTTITDVTGFFVFLGLATWAYA